MIARAHVEHDGPGFEQDESVFLVSRNLTERMKREVLRSLQRWKCNEAHFIGLACFLQRPANAGIAREAPAAIG
jgi:hypothetical protein